MTKKDFQEELQTKVKPGVKPSDLKKKLKRSKSASDIPVSSTPNIPLQKSQSQLEITLNQPSSKEQITNLQEQVKFHAETAQNYLQSLSTNQARVSDLEEKLKKNPPNVLLNEQLKEKQQEFESLRKKLEDTNTKLADTTEQLDNSLFDKHQGLKDWFQQYQKTQQLEQELAENIEQASEELISQDQIIGKLRSETTRLKQENQSLQKDFDLASKLAKMRKVPYPDDQTSWDYLKYPLYSLVIVLLTLWLTNNLRKEKHYGN